MRKVKSFTDKSDIWSVGCILFNLCTGETAFPEDADTIRLDEAKGKRAVTIRGIDEAQNGRLCDIIARTLDIGAPNRPSANPLRKQLAEIITSPVTELCSMPAAFRGDKTSNFGADLADHINFTIPTITQPLSSRGMLCLNT